MIRAIPQNRPFSSGYRRPIGRAVAKCKIRRQPRLGSAQRNRIWTAAGDDAVCAVRVRNIAAAHAVLWLWATRPLLLKAPPRIIPAWGFEDSSNMVCQDRPGRRAAGERHRPRTPRRTAMAVLVIDAPVSGQGATRCRWDSIFPLPQHDAPHRAAADAFDSGQQLRLCWQTPAAIVPHTGSDAACGPRHAACASLCIATMPHLSHSTHRNHDGKAANGSTSASPGVGSGR